MRVLLNIIWLIFAGWLLFLEYIFFGILAAILIITLPASVACFRIALFILWPFGRAVVEKTNAGTGSCLMNGVWFVVAGMWLALGHIATAILLTLTVIGIPMAVANLKLIPVTCFPFGKDIVSMSEAKSRQLDYYAL